MIAFDPNQTTPVFLRTDAQKPEASRPTFDARFVTSRERMKIARLADQAFEHYRAGKPADEEKASALATEALAIQIVDWHNIVDRKGRPILFTPDGFADILSTWEMICLVWRATEAVRLSEVDRPLSSSAAPSSAAQSATPAAGAIAAAKIQTDAVQTNPLQAMS